MGDFSQHVISAIAHVPGEDPIPLEITDATVTLDEGFAPYILCTLTCPQLDPATLDLLDPRLSVRVTVTLQRTYGDTDPISVFNAQWAGKTIAQFNTAMAGKTIAQFNALFQHPWNGVHFRDAQTLELDLNLRSRAISTDDGTVDFGLASDESLLQDFALVATSPLTAATPTSLVSIVALALGAIGVTTFDATAAIGVTVDAASGTWLPGVSAWDYMSSPVQSAGLVLRCDENRGWALVAQASVDGQINLSPDTGLTLATDTIDRDQSDWYDSVVVAYQAPSDPITGLTPAPVYDVAGAPGTRTLTLSYATAYPGPGAAAFRLAQAQGRGRQLDVTALSDYTTQPGISVSITLPDTVQSGVVSAVTWSFPDDTMTVKSRGLIDTSPSSWLLTPTGRRWQDIATGVHWNTYTP